MTLAQLKKVVAAYLGTTTADLTRDSLDLFLVAANNVRKEAELIHSFELARVSGTLSIDGVMGGSLSSVVFGGVSGGVAVSGTISPNIVGNWVAGPTINSANSYLFYATDDPSGVFYSLHYSGVQWGIYNVGTGSALWAGVGITNINDSSGSYVPNAPNTGTLTVAFSGLYAGIKELVAIQRTNASNFLEPLDFTTSDIAIQRERDAIELCDQYGFERRYPSDRSLLWNQGDRTLVLRNNTLYIYPIPTVVSGDTLDVTIEAFAFLADYTASDLLATTERDFFLSHGHQYMQWGCICEMNYLLQKFVQRQEGVLSPPEQKKAEAWKNFLVWDSFLVVNAANRSR